MKNQKKEAVRNCSTCSHSTVFYSEKKEVWCYRLWHKFGGTDDQRKYDYGQAMSPNKNCDDWEQGTENDIKNYRNTLIEKSSNNCKLYEVEWVGEGDEEEMFVLCEHYDKTSCYNCLEWRSTEGKTAQEASQEIIDAMGVQSPNQKVIK